MTWCWMLFLLVNLHLPTAWAGDTRESGSAKVLYGRIDTWIVFVSTPSDRWTWRERYDMMLLLKRAQRWLKMEESKYQTPSLRFKNHQMTRWRNAHMLELPTGTRSGLENVELVNTLLPQLGYKDSQQFLERYGHRQNQVIFFMKRDGASYAIPQESDLSNRYDLEGLVLFQAFGPQTPQCASCIAHEILHVFGAWDFYPTFQTSELQFQRANQEFPNSVMLRTSYNEFELMIDPVTQWRIGWGPKPTDAEFFTPSRH